MSITKTHSGFSILEALISLSLFTLLFWSFGKLAQDANTMSKQSKERTNESALLSVVNREFCNDIMSALSCEAPSPSHLRLQRVSLNTARGLTPNLPDPLPDNWSPYEHLENIEWTFDEDKLARISDLSGLGTELSEISSARFEVLEREAILHVKLKRVRGEFQCKLREVFICRR